MTLVRVQNDVLQVVDTDGAAILILLDLSAAFDTVDHSALLRTVEHRVGITGQALEWIKSYLSDRHQSVCINGKLSKRTELVYGVPQGSVLGPLLFTLYTLPLGDIARLHNLSFHMYADDTQIYISFKPLVQMSIEFAFNAVSACVADVRIWMGKNFLKLDDEKTEFMIITSKLTASRYAFPDFNIGDIVSFHQVKRSGILGVMFDSSLTFATHVNSVCKRSYYHLRNIGLIRKYLDQQAAATLIQAFVTSRLDYCNALLYGLPDTLQRIQNCDARVITPQRSTTIALRC